MVKIHWDGYKDFKAHSNSKDDNFTTLINFMKSYYNLSKPKDMFDFLSSDELAILMLEKRSIYSVEELETFLLNN
ncbi:MAG: hypothetical protein NTW78_09970 [Campylobacterales bacterium]|nr:hypothetical protein [Campylobacterales bacterium]